MLHCYDIAIAPSPNIVFAFPRLAPSSLRSTYSSSPRRSCRVAASIPSSLQFLISGSSDSDPCCHRRSSPTEAASSDKRALSSLLHSRLPSPHCKPCLDVHRLRLQEKSPGPLHRRHHGHATHSRRLPCPRPRLPHREPARPARDEPVSSARRSKTADSDLDQPGDAGVRDQGVYSAPG